ncbi:MAG: hypothetical protein K2L80_02265, partial [Muribaculaceae bacterium]|nr:hypothetical protein [Muribaculaceae bacterium]
LWQRTVNSPDADFTSVHTTLNSHLGMPSPDNGRLFRLLSVSYLILMLLTASLNFIGRHRAKTVPASGGNQEPA